MFRVPDLEGADPRCVREVAFVVRVDRKLPVGWGVAECEDGRPGCAAVGRAEDAAWVFSEWSWNLPNEWPTLHQDTIGSEVRP